MAPVTRSSLQGRPILREGSWQIPNEDDLPSDHAADGDVEGVEDDTAAKDHPDEGLDDDLFQEHRGMSLCPTFGGIFLLKNS